MNIGQVERLLGKIEGSSPHIARHRDELRQCASWCVDRILALGGANADERSKRRWMAAQTRVRRLLAEASGGTTADR